MNFLKRIGSFLFWRYHRLRASWPVWFYVLNRAPRRRWRAIGFSPDERGELIRAALKEDGIAVLSLSELLPGPLFGELVGEARERARRIAGSGIEHETAGASRVELRSGIFSASTKKYQKDFLVDVWGEGKTPAIDLKNPFMRLALSERVIGIVGAYLGLLPRFHYFSLLSTVILPPDAPPQYSQRWHRDSEDRQMVKVFLYLTDVDEPGAGPFTYVKGSQRDGRFGHLFPQHPPVGSYPPPGAVERAVPVGAILTCFGRAGTLIFCDTTGLHRGGYSTTKERIMFTASYVTKASLHPAGYCLPPAASLDSLSRLARFTVTG